MPSALSVRGMAGKAKVGRMDRPPLKVSAPAMSMRVLAGRLKPFATAVVIRIVAREAGMTLVTLGTTFMKIMASDVRPTMVAPLAPLMRVPVTGSLNWPSCALVMTMARPLTNPSMTGCGTSLIHFPSPPSPARI